MSVTRRDVIIGTLTGIVSIPFANLLMGAEGEKREFDYIIAGAGPAGSVLAARLAAALPDASILLMEAGGRVAKTEEDVWDPRRLVLVPSHPELEWGYQSVPQKELNGRVLNLLRGRGLGGCSLHNGMVYVRGGATGFDRWAEEGCTGWDYSSLLPHFQDIEATLNLTHAGSDPLMDDLITACAERNLPLVDDYNDQTNPLGISPFWFTIHKNRRVTAYSGFVEDRHLPNLSVMTGTLVQGLEMAGPKVTALHYSTGQGTSSISAAREVILACGAIGSPQILMLSGIGPSAHLHETGIRAKIDLPGVGANLQDDVLLPTVFLSKRPLPPQPYGLMSHVIFGDPEQRPDEETRLQTFLAPGNMIGSRLPPELQNSWSLYPCLLLPESRGTVRLQSPDPARHPLIDPAFFSAASDRQRSIAALGLMREIGGSSALDSWRLTEAAPGPDVRSDAEILEYLRGSADTCYHYAGTCKMGIDTMAVVDPQLRVYGTDNLRVVDASIIPRTVSGNTAAATMMIAHRAAGMIRAG